MQAATLGIPGAQLWHAGGNYLQYEKENDGYADDLAVMGYPGLGHRLWHLGTLT
jgi:hypothetical protein